ncbi:MAG TPA: glycosyltransferase [Candidatus Competibacteraceae bacterium]|nr:glycosyltransferase [Candidatus Competibacteraceae bacterium]
MQRISSVQIIGSRHLGGAEMFYVRLVNALHLRGQPTLAVTAQCSLIARELDSGLGQYHVAMRGIWDLPSRWRIQHLLARERPDIVQTYMGRATRLTHVRLGHGPIHVARLGGYYNLKGYRHAHAWVGNTKGICDYLVRNGLPSARVCYIGNFVTPGVPTAPDTLAALRQRLGVPEEAWVLLAVGRLHPVKGFEDLLDALGHSPARVDGRPVHLVVVGDGPLAAGLQQQAYRLGLEGRVHWAGWQTDTTPYYDLADLFICPSRYEPLGNVVLEAWAQRRPVLSTRAAGPLELARHGDNAWLVPLADPPALAQAIVHLLGDEALRARLAEHGHRQVLRQHNQEAIVEAYLALYASLLERGTAPQ